MYGYNISLENVYVLVASVCYLYKTQQQWGLWESILSMCSVRIMLCDCSLCGLSDFTFISKIPLQIRFVCRCTHLLKEDLASLVQLVSHSAASNNYDIALLVNCRSQPTHISSWQDVAMVQSVGHWLENRRKKDRTNANGWNKGIALTWKLLDLRVVLVTTWNGSPGVNLIKLLHL